MLRIKEHLTSLKNPRIKNLMLLHKPRERREQEVFIIEGLKEIEKANAAGYHFSEVYFCPDMIPEKQAEKLAGNAELCFTIGAGLFEKLSYRGNSGGLIVVAQPKDHSLRKLTLKENPLLIVLESVEKPGNIGAILRTADAAGVDAVIVSNTKTDLYNPNVIRSSLGCLFTIPVLLGETTEVIDFLTESRIPIYCTLLKASVPYHTVDFKGPAAIVMGTESTGLTSVWLQHSHTNIIIPMHGAADSLNVSTSTAIVVFEAVRQREVQKS
ncbi:MAG: RNA methyltransferase [Sphingobacteriia bacterium]|nr:RNA methyltransferase [Sphingobacteriia bacterium]